MFGYTQLAAATINKLHTAWSCNHQQITHSLKLQPSTNYTQLEAATFNKYTQLEAATISKLHTAWSCNHQQIACPSLYMQLSHILHTQNFFQNTLNNKTDLSQIFFHKILLDGLVLGKNRSWIHRKTQVHYRYQKFLIIWPHPGHRTKDT